MAWGFLNTVGRNVKDVFDANTEEDKRKRRERGEAEDYAQQQRDKGKKRVKTNLGEQAAGGVLKFLNTARAGVEGVVGLGQIAGESIFGTDESYERKVKEVDEGLDKRLDPEGGLLDAGTFFDSPEQATELNLFDNPKEYAKKVVGGGLETFADLPIGTLGKAAKGASLLKRAGVAAGEGALASAAGSTGQQLVEEGRVDPRQVALDATFGAAVSGAVPVAGAGIKGAGKVARNVDESFTPEHLRVSQNDRYTLADWGDYKMRRGNFPAKEIGDMDATARKLSEKTGIDFINGSPREIDERIAVYLENFDESRRMAREGGYVGKGEDDPIERLRKATTPEGVKKDIDKVAAAGTDTDRVAPAIAKTEDTNIIDNLARDGKSEIQRKREFEAAQATPSANPQADEIVDAYAALLRGMDDGATGGQKIPDGEGGYIRTSEHTPFYRKYYAENGRRPSQAAYREEARVQLESGRGESMHQQEFNTVTNPEYLALAGQADRGELSFEQPVGETLDLGSLERATRGEGPKLIEDVTTGRQRERGLFETAKESTTLSKEQKKAIKKLPEADKEYNEIGIDKSLAAAKNRVEADFDGMKQSFDDAYEIGRVDNEVTAAGLELYEKAWKEGRREEATEIYKKLAELGTKAGQGTVVFRSLVKKSTPDGMVDIAKKLIDDANENAGFLTRMFRKEPLKLSDDAEKAIRDGMEKVGSLKDGPEKQAAYREVVQTIQDQVPPGASELLDAWRYQNILSNPRTLLLRNPIGNAVSVFVSRPATLAFRGVNDWFKSALTGSERKAYVSDVPDYVKGLFNSMGDTVEAMKKAWAGDIQHPDLLDTKTFRPDLPKSATVVSRFMEATDRLFKSMASSGEYAVQKSRGVTDEAVARKAAEDAANFSIFRAALDTKNKTGQGKILTAIDKFSNTVIKESQKHKVLKLFVPFIRTPMNITKQFIEYSPAGFATLYGAKGAKREEQFARAMVGSVVTLIGAKMALDGATTWDVPKDPTQREIFYAQGKKPYSINIGGKWVPMITFGPLAYALGIPAAVKDANDDAPMDASQMDKLTSALTSQAKFFSNQTYLEGLDNFIKVISGQEDATTASSLGFTASQFIPLSGLQRYVSTVVDPVFRKKEGFIESAVHGTIPGMSKSLEAYQDPFTGEESRRNITDYVAPYSIGYTGDDTETARVKEKTADFYKSLRKVSPQRTKASDEINEAIKNKDLAKARQIAKEHNAKVVDAFKEWAEKYSEDVSNKELKSIYNEQKIRLTKRSVKSRQQNAAKGNKYRRIANAEIQANK